MSRYIGHYYFLLNSELIIDKCPVAEGQIIDRIYVRKLNTCKVDIHIDSYIFEGDVLYNLQIQQFEITSYEILRRNFMYQKGIRNLFHISEDNFIFVYDESL